MAFKLPPLPYDIKALEPHISARTLEFHHGKHHATYVKTLNELIAGTDLEKKSLEEIIAATAGNKDKIKIFNNAAQTWNHTFFWNSLAPGGGGAPKGTLAKKIDESFGDYEKFARALTDAATGQFGSGWAWLVGDKGGKLSIMPTPNADLPLAHGKHALLCVDVWEHAYYLDYQNRRPDFVGTVIKSLLNWEFAEANLSGTAATRAAA